MTESSTGLILRTRPLTETSLIVQWLTPGLGRLSTVAKGARRPKSPLRGKLDLFYLADFSFTRSRRSELHTLREVILRETHAALRREIGRVQQASYGTELIELTTERETPLPEIYALFAGFLKHLSQQPAQPLTVFAFEIKLLNELGQAPDLAESKLSPGAGRILETLSALDWPALSRLKPSVPQIREIGHFLHDFLLFHLGKIPRGRTLAAK